MDLSSTPLRRHFRRPRETLSGPVRLAARVANRVPNLVRVRGGVFHLPPSFSNRESWNAMSLVLSPITLLIDPRRAP